MPSLLSRPCAAAQVTGQLPGHGHLKVPFARCGDGVARHVTAVCDLKLGPFICLDCEERLTLRRPSNKRPHFAHRPDSLCSGETALHRYAKELLGRSRTLTLPVLVLQSEGLQQRVFEAGTYSFASVVIEQAVASFQPDAIVTYKGVDLAIEFLVTHAVDADKRAKVLARDLSMVEIDLSSIRAGSLSVDQLDSAILHTAPRQWIHHRRRAAVAKMLADQVAAKRAERGGRLKWHIGKEVKAAYPEGWSDEAAGSVKSAGLDHLIGLEVDCGHWFSVPRALWQAHALEHYVIQPSRQFTPGYRSLAVKGEWPNERLLASKFPAWMIRSDLSDYPLKRLAEAGYDRSSFGSADHAVWSYFAALHAKGEAVFWSREDQSFFVEAELHGRLYRRVELRRSVGRLLDAIKHDHPSSAYDAWVSSYVVGGATPAELIEAGGQGYSDLNRRLAAIADMIPSYSRKLVEDFCGLPVESLRTEKLAVIAAEAAKRESDAFEARLVRQEAIRRQAGQMLEENAPEWLGRQVGPDGVSIAEFAGSSDDALYKAERWLADAAEKRRQAIANAQLVTALRGELTQAARAAFPDTVRADLFLKAGHPKIGGRRPLDYCDSREALSYLKSLLQARR